ncbi:MAG TPA: DNA polymerase III subunit delta [Methylomirabilota bacterium]|nr:DNA polymerase III subunit delta [Methylomirabilota bacterium]
MDYTGFLRAVEAGQVPPVALLHGPEPFLLADAITTLSRALFPDPSALTLSREIFDAREAGAEAIVQAALMLPWTGARRLVVARGADGLSARQGEPLAAYVTSPNPSTALLLLADEILDASHWLLKALPAAAVVAVLPPAGRQLVGWLRARAQADGFELSEDAASLLVELSGDDLTQLLGEVEKCALVGGAQNRRVGVAEVRAVAGEHRLHGIFELTRALVRRDVATALALLEALLNAGEDPLGVLGMLAREVRAAWQAAEALRRGRAPEDIARGLRRPPAAAAALVERARALGPGAGARQLRRCWDTERRLKLGGAPRSELSLLIADLCAA